MGTGGGLSNSRCGNRRLNGCGGYSTVAVNFSLGAITGNVTSFAAAITGLSSSVERAPVGSSAITRDVT